MKYCSHCGMQLTQATKFCPECGNAQLIDAKAQVEHSSESSIQSRSSNQDIRKGIIALVQLIIFVVAGFYIYTHFIHHKNSPTPTSPASISSQGTLSSNGASDSANPRTPVVYSGAGGLSEQTAPQELSGSYKIEWKTLGDCTYYASIGSNDIFSASTATSGTNYVSNLQDGNYAISMITGPAPECGWSAKFIPTK